MKSFIIVLGAFAALSIYAEAQTQEAVTQSPPDAAGNLENERFWASAIQLVTALINRSPSQANRITCDIISPIWGGVGDGLCSGHCIYKGWTGGYCNEQNVCVCR